MIRSAGMIWHIAGPPDIPSPHDRSEQPARVRVLTPRPGLLFVLHPFTFNDFDKTETAVWGQIPEGNGPGLSSTAAFVTTPFDFSISFVKTVPDAPIPCQIHNTFASGFFEGDGGIEQEFNLEIGPGKTKTVGLAYSPI